MIQVANKDYKLIKGIQKKAEPLMKKYLTEVGIGEEEKFSFPLDDHILDTLNSIDVKSSSDDFTIFQFSKIINNIWKLLIDKSVKCLRYFDTREPFIVNKSKSPVAYGVSELGQYFDRYSAFEFTLYGGSKYYRDHVVHVFRTWLLGIDCLLENDGIYLEKIHMGENFEVNNLEKISIWTIIALTHDLGYPLEKAQDIIETTKDMMKSFVSNPVVSMDLSFAGSQNEMNIMVLKFLSSKMHQKHELLKTEKPYVARLQHKYYYKFQKSLGASDHGIISAIIIYKLLTYFLESDYSINEDYVFSTEDARQFYIRREILRSIASHTCRDIYHLDMLSFAFLLIVADDCQEWGRKRISELYVRSNTIYEFGEISPDFEKENGSYECTVDERFTIPQEDEAGLKRILSSLAKQYETYKQIFRDGLDTVNRNFTFIKKCNVTYEDDKNVEFQVYFSIPNEKKAEFNITVVGTADKDVNKKFGEIFIKNVYSEYNIQPLIIEKDKNIKYVVKNKDAIL